MSTHARASNDMLWRDLRYSWGCRCKLGCGSAPGTRHWCRKCQGMGRYTCSSGMLCWMGSQSEQHTLVGMPHMDLQNIQEYIGKSQHSSAYCKLHWIRKETDCMDQLAPPLVALEQWDLVMKSLTFAYMLFFCSNWRMDPLHNQGHIGRLGSGCWQSMRHGCHRLQGRDPYTFAEYMPSSRGTPGWWCTQACIQHKGCPGDQAGIDRRLPGFFHCKLR